MLKRSGIRFKFYTILDIGCGTLTSYEKLNKYFQKTSHYIGIDFSIEMLKYGLSHNINKNFDIKLPSVILADAENLPLKNEVADLVISLTVAQNLPDLTAHLKSILNIIKKNSSIILISFHKSFFSLNEIKSALMKFSNIDFDYFDVDDIEDYLFVIKFN